MLINNEPWLIRTISLQTGTRVHAFRHAVRWRDRRCLISGKEAIDPDNNEWTGLEAAHIFPLAQEGYWNDNNYGRWISLSPQIGGAINSVQNGLLLRSDIHQLFDSYGVSINPDVSCLSYVFYEVIVANNYFRIITRSCVSVGIQMVSPVNILIKNSLMILNDPLTSFCVGILGRQSWPT